MTIQPVESSYEYKTEATHGKVAALRDGLKDLGFQLVYDDSCGDTVLMSGVPHFVIVRKTEEETKKMFGFRKGSKTSTITIGLIYLKKQEVILPAKDLELLSDEEFVGIKRLAANFGFAVKHTQ